MGIPTLVKWVYLYRNAPQRQNLYKGGVQFVWLQTVMITYIRRPSYLKTRLCYRFLYTVLLDCNYRLLINTIHHGRGFTLWTTFRLCLARFKFVHMCFKSNAVMWWSPPIHPGVPDNIHVRRIFETDWIACHRSVISRVCIVSEFWLNETKQYQHTFS